MQGQTTQFYFWQVSTIDDDVGGAVETGTIQGSMMYGHMSVNLPTLQSLEQGLETPVIADIIIQPRVGDITVRERDQLQVVGPQDHPHINEYWRVIGVNEPAMHPHNRNRFIRIRAKRIRRDRTEALM